MKVAKRERDMSKELIQKGAPAPDMSAIEQVVMKGDLSPLTAEQRVLYYNKVCESAGLNPLTNPFAYIQLNGKLTLYAKKDCTEQLRKIHGVSIEDLDDKIIDDLYIVTAKAKDKHGRCDTSKGAVVLGNLKGEAKANAIMKAETKAKRRVTLSICGMGFTDESEVESIPHAKTIDIDMSTGEVKGAAALPIKKEEPIAIETQPAPSRMLNNDEMEAIRLIVDDCNLKYQTWFYNYIGKQYGNLAKVPLDKYEPMKASVEKQRAEDQAKLVNTEMDEALAAKVAQ